MRRSNARQIRDTVDFDIQVAAAIDRLDQYVSCPGVSSNVSALRHALQLAANY